MQECEDCISELRQTSAVAIVGDRPVQDRPKPLDRIEMGATGRQLDQMDTASCPCKKNQDIRPFLAGGGVPVDMKDALAGVTLRSWSETARH